LSDANSEYNSQDQTPELLIVDEYFEPAISDSEAANLKSLLKKFVESYIANKDRLSFDQWLAGMLKEELPEHSEADISAMCADIQETLSTNKKNLQSLESSIQAGHSKESWFADKLLESISYTSQQEMVKHLQSLDDAIFKANDALHGTLTTKAGLVNQNSNLDGFIAEQYHAQRFNLNAETAGSPLRARVVKPTGAYSKNGVDIVIEDSAKNVVKRYQSKYCENAEATLDAFQSGDYRGQQKLVPDDQLQDFCAKGIKATNRIEADGITSEPLTKAAAKEQQAKAQKGESIDLDWNAYKAKHIALGIGKQAGKAGLLGAVIGASTHVIQKSWRGEKIKGEEVVETALKTGADFGIKGALTGAIKAGAEKGILRAIPKGTPVGVIANIVFVGVENVKVLMEVAQGKLTLPEGIAKMERVTVSIVAGIAAGAKGMALGAMVGSVFGPIGTAVGGFIGGTVGYMAGSKIGDIVVTTAQRVRAAAGPIITRTITRMIATAGRSLQGVGRVMRRIFT
jgi:hypothetical protein